MRTTELGFRATTLAFLGGFVFPLERWLGCGAAERLSAWLNYFVPGWL
jgi:hypothetical protein